MSPNKPLRPRRAAQPKRTTGAGASRPARLSAGVMLLTHQKGTSIVDAESVAKLFDRAAHFSAALTALGGTGCSWSHTFPDGETHRYVLKSIKSPEQIEHELLTLAVWLWSLKDYMKGRAAALGKSPQEVENYASNDPYLPLCADLANGAKHGRLTTSRSGKWPRLGKLQYDIPQKAIGSITFRAFEVETDIAHPELITVTFRILDTAGATIGDAFSVLGGALEAWERFSAQLERAA